MKTITLQDVLSSIDTAVRIAGSRRALARQWGCTNVYLYQVQKGRRPPGPLVLDKLGLAAEEPVLRFRRVGKMAQVVPEGRGRGPRK